MITMLQFKNDYAASSQREVENTMLAAGSELLAVKSLNSVGGQLQLHSKPQIERLIDAAHAP